MNQRRCEENASKKKKIITMYGGLYPRSNVQRLYLPRSERRSGVVSIENCVSDERKNYLHWLLCKKYHLQCSDKRYTHTSKHTHVRTHHNQSREITNIKSFGISLFKQIKSQSPGYQTQFVLTSKRECQIVAFAIPGDQNIAIK